MWSKYQKLKVGFFCLAVVAFGWEGQAQDLTTRATGCLGPDGDLSRFAFGDDPLESCSNDEDQVSFKLDDLTDGAATVPFFVTLRFGEEQTIAENGALELRARCILESGAAGAVELVVISTLDGWFATGAGNSTSSENLAGDEVVFFSALGRPDQGRISGLGSDRLAGAQLALAPDGSFLALASGSTALGIGVFDQDCLAVGTADLILGDLPGTGRFAQRLEGLNGISGGVTIGGRTFGAGQGAGLSVSIGTGNSVAGPISRLSSGISGFGGSGISRLAE